MNRRKITIKYLTYDVMDYKTHYRTLSIDKMKNMFDKYVVVTSGHYDGFFHYSVSVNDSESAFSIATGMNETDSFERTGLVAFVLPLELVKYELA